MIYLLDTDHLTPLERGGTASFALQMRLDRIPAVDIATTTVNYEEQMRGWLSRASQANSIERLLAAYARLETDIETFQSIPRLRFDAQAASEFERLRRAHIRIGTMDLRIATVCLANDATLLTRNLGDFHRVPGLRAQDWLV